MPVFTVESFEPYVLSDRAGVFAAIEIECVDVEDSPLHLSCVFLLDYASAKVVNYEHVRDGQRMYKARFPAAAYSALLDLLRHDGSAKVMWSPYKSDGGARVVIGSFPDPGLGGERPPIGFAASDPDPA